VPPDAVEAGGAVRESVLRIVAGDGAGIDLAIVEPIGAAHAVVLWLPALGVSARNYLPFSRGLAARGIAVGLHEWRGAGSSDRRAGRSSDWGYRELLVDDIAASRAAIAARVPATPLYLGGHSLGGQLAVLDAARAPDGIAGLLLVASGSPFWRCFRRALLIRAFYSVVPIVGALAGHFPGRLLGFGGREARGVMRDWSRSGRSGRYCVDRLAADLEAGLAEVAAPVHAVRLADDWLGPAASLDWLLAKLARSPATVSVLGRAELGVAADHFAWLKSPQGVVDDLLDKSFFFK
jgi:predicted alpha/beta hydrolase